LEWGIYWQQHRRDAGQGANRAFAPDAAVAAAAYYALPLRMAETAADRDPAHQGLLGLVAQHSAAAGGAARRDWQRRG